MCDCEIQVVEPESQAPTESALAQWLEYIESIFASLTIGECLDVLIDLGHQCARYRGADGTLYTLTDLYSIPDCMDDPGDTCYVEFLGGPPGKNGWGSWFRGTLITWVVDGLLYDFATNGGELAMPIIEECEAFINDTDEDDEYDEYDEWEGRMPEIAD